MPRFVIFDEFGDVVFEHAVVFFDTYGRRFHNESFGTFARFVVWDGDYGAVCYGGVGQKVGFEFCWGDLKALMLRLDVH